MGRTARNGQDGSLRIAGRYRLVEKLGTGGMSEVWRGYDETLGRPVAVKVLSPRLAGDQAFRDRLRQEALAAARLCHPHITGIFDFGESPLDDRLTVPYVVMELNDGESVSARISRQGPLPWREAVTIAVAVASALATAHARGLVHRDVTPANVMLTGAGAKVVDFGISAIVGQRDAAPDGSLLGTPAYLAPERLGGAQVSAATDVYALGLLLYRALTGRLPWPAETTAEALRAHLYADPDPLPAFAGMPAAVADLCLRCLAKSPADRPGAADVARALAATVGLQPIIPPAPERVAGAAQPARGSAVPQPASRPLPGTLGRTPPAGPTAVMGATATTRAGATRTKRTGGTGVPSGNSITPASRNGAASTTWVGATPMPGPVAVASTGLSRALLAYLGLPGGGPGPRPSLRVLRLRAGLRIGTALRLGATRPLGGGLFTAGRGLLTVRPGGLPIGHRTQAGMMTVAVLAATGVAWAATRETPEVRQAQAAGTGAAAAAAGTGERSCSVRYQLRRDSGRDYEAQLTVAATGEAGQGAWRVQFSYPGTQRLTGAPKAVTQTGRKVTARGHGRLKSFTLRGDYSDYNPLPLAFTLDGHRCRAEVLGSVAVSRHDERGREERPRPADSADAGTAERVGGHPGEGSGEEAVSEAAADKGGGERSGRARKDGSPRKRVQPPARPAKPTPKTNATPVPPPTARKGNGLSLTL